jgi:putative Holliday junction resolvase
MKYLGIDYGTKHIGIAVSDDGGSMAFPGDKLSNNKNLVENIKKLVGDRKIEGVVMGESKDFAGNENAVMEGARAFARALETELGLTVSFVPEFLTSVEARHIQGGSDKTHSSAAAIILQSFLDQHNVQ